MGSLLTFHREMAGLSLYGRAGLGLGLVTTHSPADQPVRLPCPHSQGRKPVCVAGRGGSWRSINSTVVFPEARPEFEPQIRGF